MIIPRQALRHSKTLPILRKIGTVTQSQGYPEWFVRLEVITSNLLVCENCDFMVEYNNGATGCLKKHPHGCGS